MTASRMGSATGKSISATHAGNTVDGCFRHFDDCRWYSVVEVEVVEARLGHRSSLRKSRASCSHMSADSRSDSDVDALVVAVEPRPVLLGRDLPTQQAEAIGGDAGPPEPASIGRPGERRRERDARRDSARGGPLERRPQRRVGRRLRRLPRPHHVDLHAVAEVGEHSVQLGDHELDALAMRDADVGLHTTRSQMMLRLCRRGSRSAHTSCACTSAPVRPACAEGRGARPTAARDR